MTGQRGSATILAAAAIGMTVLVSSVLVVATVLVGDRMAAQTAADAAALAAAPATFPSTRSGAPALVAAEYAARNGTVLVTCRCPIDPRLAPRTVRVQVERLSRIPFWGTVTVRAGASAEFDPVAALRP